jgi:2-succinyl-5-enolpyruvyl-6-hydroxy-3-cyclohexene-1-carboxylate synthase
VSLPWAAVAIEALAASGVRDVIVCPGSRSAPLALAAAASELRVQAIVDERSAGFFALGLARASGRPAAVLCTSGTAGAHLYPAIIEASMAAVPLIVITADRPGELHGCGAPQTIEQRGLFAGFVRREIDLGAAVASPLAARAAARKVAHAVAAARGPIPGPVHINAPAREPLADATPLPPFAPPPPLPVPALAPAPETLAALRDRVGAARSIAIAAGPATLAARSYREPLLSACGAARVPVLAEASSQLRLCPEAAGPVIGGFAELLRRGAPPRALAPDLVVEIAAPPIAAGYQRWIASRPAPRLVLAAHQAIDPESGADLIVVGDLAVSVAALAAALSPSPDQARLFAAWSEAGGAAAERLEAELRPDDGRRMVRAACAALPAGAAVMAGNSLPIRWLEHAVDAAAAELDVLHQRGASGIDGLIAGAAGAAAAGDRPVCLLIGDVSCAHDLGSLAVAAAASAPLILCVLDNRGGRIFSELPYAGSVAPAVLERLFLTPPAIDLVAAARAFGLAAAAADSDDRLFAEVTAALDRRGATLIRATCNEQSTEVIRP